MTSGITEIKTIRAKLGCHLREAKDFYDRGPKNWEERLAEHVEYVAKTGVHFESVEEKIRNHIRDYYLALDQRQHGGVAQDKAFRAIEQTLNMSWTQGAELQRRERLAI